MKMKQNIQTEINHLEIKEKNLEDEMKKYGKLPKIG